MLTAKAHSCECDFLAHSAALRWDKMSRMGPRMRECSYRLDLPPASVNPARPDEGRSVLIRHSSFVILSGLSPAFQGPVPEAAPTASPPTSDITFTCAHCSSALVVDAAAAGMTLECQRCGKLTPVPAVPPRDTQSVQAQAQLADLERQLKENESQRTEITGYINQLSIQLHRWQLRLQTLNERRQQLEKELRAAKVL